MALFGKKKEEKNPTTPEASKGKEEKNKAEKPAVVSVQGQTDLSWVLHAPRMSEKAMYAADRNVYVFNIDPRANKQLIKEALKVIYKIEPVKINVSKIAKKKVRNQRTGIVGVKAGGKKAYVYLKDGDKINIV